ncbi:prepilin-type N-terminal cleavage/methylation domain-containing protein [Oceanithermus sp.]|uniref:prepilin-type N-terminal cleavage/methylation domain-containing protein n=1 Tax=Oceanithermus sp. TaxID=2268145 RepID=UPI0025DB98F9|nr:prepilin-type N-terminal cleavage/methylation domain-containing protein [Oceanithermus sp.]
MSGLRRTAHGGGGMGRGVAPRRGRGPRAPARGTGFSLLELVVVVALIAILWFVAIDRMLQLRIDAERVAMLQVLGGLRSALGLEVAERVVRRGLASVTELQGANPMDLLAERPHNYLGELDGPDPAQVPPGSWYFDTRTRTLVYRVRYPEAFEGGPAEGPPRARFRVEVVWRDRDGDGRLDPRVDAVGGVRLAPVEPYRWKTGRKAQAP